MNREIFISYSWDVDQQEKKNELIVNEICDTLLAMGWNIKRDKKDVHFKGNILEFEERLGKAGYIILVISDKFLKSRHCMFEVLRITEHKNVYDRIFPIILDDARILSNTDPLYYINYWNTEKSKLDEQLRSAVELPYTTNIHNQLRILADIARVLDGFAETLRQMKTLSVDQCRASNFKELIDAIKKQAELDAAQGRHPSPTTESITGQQSGTVYTDVGIVAGNVTQTGQNVSGRDMHINNSTNSK